MTDLTDILDGAWARLHESAEVRDAGFRLTQLATISETGLPQLRTVVLRGASKAGRTLRIHTDIRSPKVREICAQPAVSLVAYSHAHGQQIRIDGTAVAHHQNDVARMAWRRSHQRSLICYGAPLSPGTPLSSPTEADFEGAMPEPRRREAGNDPEFENFCAVVITVRRLDWLDLAQSGHRRAVFDWQDGDWRGTWVAP